MVNVLRIVSPPYLRVLIQGWLNPQTQDPRTRRTYCTSPFYVRLEHSRFGVFPGALEPIPRVYIGRTVHNLALSYTHTVEFS